jgi:hypothetical protein
VTGPEAVRGWVARLAHDVGKYIARTARNVEPGGWTPELGRMLCRDLYALPGGRAAAVFERLASALERAAGPQPALAEVRGRLARIDRLEGRVRAGEPSALEEAAALSLAVEQDLRAFAQNLRKDQLRKDQPQKDPP